MCEKDIPTDVLPEFVPYNRTQSNAPESSSFLWFGSKVNVVLVSISNINQENTQVSVITHQYTASHVSETVTPFGQ